MPKRYLLPGGGGTGQFGSTQSLFPKPVAKVIVCGYSQAKLLGANELSGVTATALVQGMESSAPGSSPTGAENCPPRSGTTLDIIATATDGSTLPDVTGDVSGCQGAQLTNGTAVRFGWSVPAWLTLNASPSPTMSGSPAR